VTGPLKVAAFWLNDPDSPPLCPLEDCQLPLHEPDTFTVDPLSLEPLQPKSPNAIPEAIRKRIKIFCIEQILRLKSPNESHNWSYQLTFNYLSIICSLRKQHSNSPHCEMSQKIPLISHRQRVIKRCVRVCAEVKNPKVTPKNKQKSALETSSRNAKTVTSQCRFSLLICS